jgi:hypothetical protein
MAVTYAKEKAFGIKAPALPFADMDSAQVKSCPAIMRTVQQITEKLEVCNGTGCLDSFRGGIS